MIENYNLPVDVSRFGIHWTDSNVAFLEQGGPKGGTNVLGLKERSPFRVSPAGHEKRCNHLIPMTAHHPVQPHQEVFERLMADPLVQAMLPLPKPEGHSGIWYLPSIKPDLELWLAVISRMSSPIHTVMRPFWSLDNRQIADELKLTDVQPLVLTGIEPAHVARMHTAVRAAVTLPRRLILVGDPEIPLLPDINPVSLQVNCNIKDVLALPWENQGAMLIRKYMRGELDGSAS